MKGDVAMTSVGDPGLNVEGLVSKGSNLPQGPAQTLNRARDAYLNTTKGVLTGRPYDDDVRQAKEMLDRVDIAYLFNPDATRPRPMFCSRDWTSIGIEEIKDHIERICGDVA